MTLYVIGTKWPWLRIVAACGECAPDDPQPLRLAPALSGLERVKALD